MKEELEEQVQIDITVNV